MLAELTVAENRFKVKDLSKLSSFGFGFFFYFGAALEKFGVET